MNKRIRLKESELVRLIQKTLKEEKQILNEWFQYVLAAWNIYKAGRDAGWWMVAPPSTNEDEFAEFMAKHSNVFGGDRGKTPRNHMDFVNMAKEAGADVGEGRGKGRGLPKNFKDIEGMDRDMRFENRYMRRGVRNRNRF